MKLIEAMKRVKQNEEKIADLQLKIGSNSAHTTLETPLYDDVRERITGWLQACTDLSMECVKLLASIQRTNLATKVKIEVEEGVFVEHSIAEWVWRRRKYAALDMKTWSTPNDRGIREGQLKSTIADAPAIDVKIVRNYDPVLRDKKVAMFRSEPGNIDAALEIVNATTDLIEA